jgi:hypothetical protein
MSTTFTNEHLQWLRLLYNGLGFRFPRFRRKKHPHRRRLCSSNHT